MVTIDWLEGRRSKDWRRRRRISLFMVGGMRASERTFFRSVRIEMSSSTNAAAAGFVGGEKEKAKGTAAIVEQRKSVTHEILDAFRAALATCCFVRDVSLSDVFRQTDALVLMDEALIQGRELLSCNCFEATCHHPTHADSEERLVVLRNEWGERLKRQLYGMPDYSHDKRGKLDLLIPYLYNGDPRDDRVFKVDMNNPEYLAALAERPEHPVGGEEAYKQRLKHFMMAMTVPRSDGVSVEMRRSICDGVPDAYFEDSSSSEASEEEAAPPPSAEEEEEEEEEAEEEAE
jgi:hypothetical protein